MAFIIKQEEEDLKHPAKTTPKQGMFVGVRGPVRQEPGGGRGRERWH